MERYGDLDSKFRFVILASKRAKQLLQGAKPKIKTKSRNLIRIAQAEVMAGLVDYEIIQPKKEEAHEAGDIFIGEEIREEESIETSEKKKKKPKKAAQKKPKGNKKKEKT
ncbi:MAG: DNA-directed RNA polymerase subunit omega [Candidatus Aminicenantes bacterium]|nr:MAG: DNA-directed RNA polymerase subunit omega [Candidatus Aminicenantes bacterium]